MSMLDIYASNSIVALFDVNNVEHLKAYKHLDATGRWPKGFLNSLHPAVLIPNGWNLYLQSKMVDAWIEYKFKETHAKIPANKHD